MHSLLLVVDRPPSPTIEQKESWRKFVGEAANTAEQMAEIQTLAENVWLFPSKNGLRTLVEMCRHAESWKFQYRILCFPDAPQWISS